MPGQATSSSRALSPPSLSVTLALDPFKEDEAIRLSATVVSHASYPITILTHSTFLDLRDAQSRTMGRSNFHCTDVDTGTLLQLQWSLCGLRLPIRHRLEDSDSQYFQTLHPETPSKICGPCLVRHHKLAPGHKYRLDVEDNQVIPWWRQGTKEDVLASPGQELPEHMLKPSGSPIIVTNIEPLEFTVPLDWENVGASIAADFPAMAGSSTIGTTAPPLITTTLSMDISTSCENVTAELSIFLTSRAQTPVTIWISSTIVDMNALQWQDGLSLTHLDTKTSIPTQDMFHLSEDGWVPPRDRYFHTLLPGKPYKFSATFTPRFMKYLELRHGTYRLATDVKKTIKWWKTGTREELIAPIGQKPFDGMYEASGEPITLAFEPIEFTIPTRL